MTEGHNRSSGLTELLSNRPLIVGALFLGTYFAPFLILIGLPLAYVFRRRPDEDWEATHFQYLIRTFWISILVAAVAGLSAIAIYAGLGDSDETTFAIAAILVIASGMVLAFSGVRTVISLMNSSSRKPIGNPKTWLI